MSPFRSRRAFVRAGLGGVNGSDPYADSWPIGCNRVCVPGLDDYSALPNALSASQ